MKILRRNTGSALPMVLIISALVAIFSYIIFNLLQSRRTGSEDELRALQAKMLASDIVELGKYFLYYERVIYLQSPLKIDSARGATKKDFAAQSYGSLVASNSFMLNACGGYDANAVEVGTFVANSTPVFCPLYLRNPLMDGDMFEDMMLDMWSRSGVSGQLVYSGGNLVTNSVTRTAIMSKDATGAFVVEVDFADVIQNADNQFIRLHLDQNIVKSMRQNGFSAKLRFKLFPTSSGYKTMSNERYVTVESEVMYGSALDRKYVNVNESIILYTTTVKDFAIFMMYPETVSGVLSNKSSLTMNLGGPSSKIYGRVFFNGDIDTPLENLPEFNELVIISGNLIVNGKTFDQARTLIAKKFKKGLVVRFPVKRLVNDGECIAGLKTANQSGMFCKDNLNPAVNADTSTYIRNLGNICSGLKVTYKSGDFTYDYTGVVNPIIKEQCKGSEPEHVILSGGSTTVNVTGSYAFIVSPVKTLISGSATNIYGTIFGGHLETKDGSRFYSLSALRKGLPGIASDADLSAISSEAERVSAGVGVALLNLPLVRQATNGK